ncbi:MAG: hypothetical protein JO270_04055 [Acidobacteriaceae bacterium]|nr:hypothetical protein [Acidobacteriaceae bacterium]
MLLYEILLAIGLLLIIGLMAVFINPPEAWIKKALRRATADRKTGKGKAESNT